MSNYTLIGTLAVFRMLWEKTSNWRFTIILAALVFIFIAATLIEPGQSSVGFDILRLASTVVVLTAVLASTDRAGHLYAIIALVVGWLATTWLPVGGTILIGDALLVVIFFYIVLLLTGRLVRPHKITLDDISGGVAVYLCLALAWAVSYRLIDNLSPGAFSVNFQGDIGAALYFSMTTITTLGYGDIAPVARFARLWATLEAVVGLLYVAVLISRLVSEYRR
jgi:hypothetical protein